MNTKQKLQAAILLIVVFAASFSCGYYLAALEAARAVASER